MHIVKKFASHFEVQLPSDLPTSLADMLGLHRNVSFSVKPDCLRHRNPPVVDNLWNDKPSMPAAPPKNALQLSATPREPRIPERRTLTLTGDLARPRM